MKGCNDSRVHASTCATLTFATMNGHSLDPLEQQIFVDGIHICLLLCKDEHLSGKAKSRHGGGLCPDGPSIPQRATLLPSPLVWARLVGCTHGRGRLLQALEQIHHLGLLLYIFHLLPSETKSGGSESRFTNHGLATEVRPPNPGWEVTSSLCYQELGTLRMFPAKGQGFE